MLGHLDTIRLHWRLVLTVVFLAAAVWSFLPAGLKKSLKDGWKKIGRAIGDFNARVILTVLYSTIVALFGLPVRFFGDLLHTKKRPEAWFDHPPIPNTLDEARRQG